MICPVTCKQSPARFEEKDTVRIRVWTVTLNALCTQAQILTEIQILSDGGTIAPISARILCMYWWSPQKSRSLLQFRVCDKKGFVGWEQAFRELLRGQCVRLWDLASCGSLVGSQSEQCQRWTSQITLCSSTTIQFQLGPQKPWTSKLSDKPSTQLWAVAQHE